VRGGLFTRDFLEEGIAEQPAWKALDDAVVTALAGKLRTIFKPFPVAKTPNEAVTEEDLIHPIVQALGWTDYLPQTALGTKELKHVPDLLLFANPAAKMAAQAEGHDSRRFRHGVAILESKRWLRPLDKAEPDEGTPSSQILAYLNRADIQSDRRIKWGILTNGRHWRLYWQDAKSQSEHFLELDLPVILGVPDTAVDLFSHEERKRGEHFLKVFLLMFRRESFLPGPDDARTFHESAIAETRKWEARVADDLSGVVFGSIFPDLVKAIIRNDPARPTPLGAAYLSEARRAALVLLYRLLFVLYAEDRNLLPAGDKKYDDYALDRLRTEVAQQIDDGAPFSDRRTIHDNRLKELFRALDEGDTSIGLPPYNGGLFDRASYPLLERVRLPDRDLALVIDRLSRRDEGGRLKRINYRDLTVQQIGSIYERLLEFEAVPDPADPAGIVIRPNIFARKGSGSYYTPDDLVRLIIERTIGPLVEERWSAFEKRCDALAKDRRSKDVRLEELRTLDPASVLLDLKVCDPAMGSGHFLVSLVDYLADTVLRFVEDAEACVFWADYRSPLIARIDDIRARIVGQARKQKWIVDEHHLDLRHIVRRMILKRVIYGVDKNRMAVELAKVSLWLHSFTVGAPLSFLDHHLRCGDSLYGEFVRPVEDMLTESGAGLFIVQPLQRARAATAGMAKIEQMTDADIAEVRESRMTFEAVEEATRPMNAVLDFVHALRWLDVRIGRKTDTAAAAILDGHLGPQVDVIAGKLPIDSGDDPAQGSLLPRSSPKQGAFAGKAHVDAKTRADALELLARARAIAARERFLHWQVAFPGVWDKWESAEPEGGFDAVIGNPPWDRIKLQEVEWFAQRRPEIARQARASDRKKMIAALEKKRDPLWDDYLVAKESAESAVDVARKVGDYPLLSGGDINIYSLFVERAQKIVKPTGLVGLLVPSGIAADKGASEFFKSVATTGRLAALFDFENGRREFATPNFPAFFPDVDSRFKFSAFVSAGAKRRFAGTASAFFLHDVSELANPERCFALAAEDFARINPNTGTAPVMRTRRDAEITRGIYRRLPILHDHAKGAAGRVWPVKYLRMFDMTNDAHLFKMRAELEKQGFYPVAGNRMTKGKVEYLPLYEGKMVQAYDHRAASVVQKAHNLNRPAQPEAATPQESANPNWLPSPQFWVDASRIPLKQLTWFVGFKEITAPTNARTVIASSLPRAAAGNKIPLLVPDKEGVEQAVYAPLLLGNLNSLPFDFVARQKIHGQTLNWYIVEQLPVIPPADFARRFGAKTAAEVVKEHVLHLTYTALDMKPFAEDMGYAGPPFRWDEEDRRRRRAVLDALFFHLYGLGEDAAAYILDTFPILREQDEAAFGRFRTKEMVLAYMKALAAGDPDARIAA
jgi:hypothetical protein